MRKLMLVMIISVLLPLFSCTLFQNKPSSDNIAAALVDKISSYTEIAGIDIKATEDTGTKVEPKYEMRFVAKIKLLSSTYEKVGHIGGNVDSDVLRELFAQGAAFEVFGKATSILKKEEWVTKIDELESSVNNLGQLSNNFKRPVIEGSKEHESAMAKYSEWQKAEAEAQAKAEKEKAEKIESYAKAFSGKWKGTYICGQGTTGLTLDVSATLTSLSAIFNFYPVAENSSAKSGSYSLVGQFNLDGTFELKPSKWIERPSGYAMVGMAGNINDNHNELLGSITSNSCKEFLLKKQ